MMTTPVPLGYFSFCLSHVTYASCGTKWHGVYEEISNANRKRIVRENTKVLFVCQYAPFVNHYLWYLRPRWHTSVDTWPGV